MTVPPSPAGFAVTRRRHGGLATRPTETVEPTGATVPSAGD
jgi:hypothetical protein